MPARSAPRPLVVAQMVAMGLLLLGSAAYLGTGIAFNLLVAGPGHANRLGNTVGTDFSAFWAAGAEARAGRVASLYDMETLRAAHAGLVGRDVPPYPWAYPPSLLLLLAPLSLLPLVPALWTWLAATLALLATAVRRLAPHPLTLVLVPLFPAVAQSILTGPTGCLTAGLFAAGIGALATRPALAGACFAGLCYKPHLALLVPPCLVAAGQHRALGAMIATGAALVVASAAAFGVGSWTGFIGNRTGHLEFVVRDELPWVRMPTVFVAVLRATGSAAAAGAAQAASLLVAIAACVWVWRRTDVLAWRALALAAGVPLASPYAFDYDTAVLVTPFALLAWRARDRGLDGGAAAALAVMWAAPLGLWFVSRWLGQQPGPLVFGGLLAYAAHGARRA